MAVLNGDILEELFDETFYSTTYNVEGPDLYEHYLKIGWKNFYDPSEKFSTAGYLFSNTDVKEAGINPLLHYLSDGCLENRSWISTRDLIIKHTKFDVKFYYSRYFFEYKPAEDPADWSVKDFIVSSAHGGKNLPYKDFDASKYGTNNNYTALLQSIFMDKTEDDEKDAKYREEYNLIKESPLFDEKWYRTAYRITSDIDAVDHYLRIGGFKGLCPSTKFNSARYLINSRDVYANGINPLIHWIMFGKNEKSRAPFALFKTDASIAAQAKADQDIDIREYPANSDKLIVFVVPTQDFVGGGVMSINSIAKVTKELTQTLEELKGYEVVLATNPSSHTFHKFTKFNCAFKVYRFEQLKDYFHSVDSIIVHLPEFYATDFISQLSPESDAWLCRASHLRFNILNQNNDMMPRPYIVDFLRARTDDVTMTCAHRRYCVPQQRSSYSIPVHMLSTSNLVEYKYTPYEKKENILLYSPDANPMKDTILEKIHESFPDLKMKMIKDMDYSDYLELISRAKWMITFGEGLDGYAMESIRSGAISFAVYNHTFFNERFENLPNIYSSYTKMLESIVEDIRRFDNPDDFKKLNDLLIKKDREEKDEQRYRENIRLYYKGEYTYPTDNLFEEREKRVAEKPLISIVMATYNGEKYLKKQLESIAALTYKNTELIISDDGSTDGTLDIINEFAEKYPLTLLYNEGRHGCTFNFENGLKHVNGEYVALCDQDDIWIEDRMEKLLSHIDEFDIVHGRVSIIDKNDNFHPAAIMHSHYETSKVSFINVEDVLQVPRLLGCTSLIRTSLIKACMPFPDEIPYHDWWLSLIAVMNGNGICFTDELVTKYRQHGENTALSEYKDGSSIAKRLRFMNYLKKTKCDEFNNFQLDLISRLQNCNIIALAMRDAAHDGFETFINKHTLDFSDELMDTIVKLYKEKNV